MIRAAIVGMGRWGRVLVDAVQERSQSLCFMAGTTRTLENAAAYADERGIALKQSYQALLVDPDIDAIVLATPHSQHCDQVQQAARAGKHVFVEKPFSLRRLSALKAIDSARSAGIVLALGHNRRFLPAMQALKRLLEGGTLGTPLHVEGNMSGNTAVNYKPDGWRISHEESPLGGMAGAGIHLVDAMIHLLGPIRSVQAQSYSLAVNLDMDDTTSMLFRFDSGATGYLGAMTTTAVTFRLHVYGTKGAAELEGENKLIFHPVEGGAHITEFVPCDTVRAELEAFAGAIANRGEYPVPLDEVLNGVAAFEAAVHSAAAKERRSVD